MLPNFIKNTGAKIKSLLQPRRIKSLTSDGQRPAKPPVVMPVQDRTTPVEPKTEKKTPLKKQPYRPRRKRNKPAKSSPAPVYADWDLNKFKVIPVQGQVRFHDLGLPDEVMHAISDLGYQYCTPIQAEIMPAILTGRDACGRAQTGTGKTAAFLIAIITHLGNQIKNQQGCPRVLIIGPTRELVIQIAEEARSLSKYCHLKIVTLFGGMDYQKQKRQIQGQNLDIIVATPGRLLDFKRQKDLDLRQVEIMVIDEADRMLDMGFIPDVRQIIRSTPPKEKRQTLLFSATLTTDVKRLAGQWTQKALDISIEPDQVEADSVIQHIYLVTDCEKNALLYNIIARQKLKRVIVFCNRRDQTNQLADLLRRYKINCAVLSGAVPQKKRLHTLDNFRHGHIKVLIATDVAGRGIHIDDISHVINYTLPLDPEDYVHRIGRTGRAGAAGISISFATEADSFQIPAIEEYVGHELRCVYPDEEWLAFPKSTPAKRSNKRKRHYQKTKSKSD